MVRLMFLPHAPSIPRLGAGGFPSSLLLTAAPHAPLPISFVLYVQPCPLHAPPGPAAGAMYLQARVGLGCCPACHVREASPSSQVGLGQHEIHICLTPSRLQPCCRRGGITRTRVRPRPTSPRAVKVSSLIMQSPNVVSVMRRPELALHCHARRIHSVPSLRIALRSDAQVCQLPTSGSLIVAPT